MEKRISCISGDMEYYLDGWQNNSKATEAQKKRWPQKRKINKAALGVDGEDPIILLKKDGFDGEPVGSLAANTARHYFQFTTEHKRPPDRDLIRFGLFFHLDFYKTLALVLKGQFELFFSKEMSGMVFPKIYPKEAEEKSKNFNPGMNKRADAKGLYLLFEEHNNFASSAGYDEEKFNTLINLMIQSSIHLFPTNSPEIEKFSEKQKAELALLTLASGRDAEQFWILKCSWLEAQNEVGNKLYELEKQRLNNANINQKWLAAFGHVYLPLLEAEFTFFSLQRQIQLKEADLDLTKEKLEKLEARKREEEMERLKEMAMEMAFGQFVGLINGNGAQVDDNYMKECKKILREIWKYTHVDCLAHESFTENQKKKLREYFDRAIRIRDHEKGYTDRSLDDLRDILAQVKALWNEMGHDIPEDLIIQGDGLKAHMQWLEEQIQKLEEEVKKIRAEILALINDKDLREKQASLASDDQIKKIIKEMEEKKKHYEEQIAVLKSRLQELFQLEDAPK